jgi:putative transposase
MIYTTNAVKALHRSLRKSIKTRGSFPNDEAATRLLYLAMQNADMRWRRGIERTNAGTNLLFSSVTDFVTLGACRP